MERITERILRLPEVIKRTGRSRSSIYSDMSVGEFPNSVKLGARAVGWTESSINQWIDDKTDNGE